MSKFPAQSITFGTIIFVLGRIAVASPTIHFEGLSSAKYNFHQANDNGNGNPSCRKFIIFLAQMGAIS